MSQIIRHQNLKFSSSTQKVNSKTIEKTINLGKLLVSQIGDERDVDTLTKWMLHYIADKIVQSEKTTGKYKKASEKECFETILKLWQHRAVLKNGYRPFENYEKIFTVLDKINPDEKDRPFYNQPKLDLELGKNQKNTNKNVNLWLATALHIDDTAKVLLEYAFEQASLSAKSRNVKSYLTNISDQTSGKDIEVIIKYIDKSIKQKKIKDELKEKKIKELKERIYFLNSFTKLSIGLRKELKSKYILLVKEKSIKKVVKSKRK